MDKAGSAPVQPREKIAWEGDDKQTDKQTDFVTTRPTRPRGFFANHRGSILLNRAKASQEGYDEVQKYPTKYIQSLL